MPLPIVRLVLIREAIDFVHKANELCLQNIKQISVALQIKTTLTMGNGIRYPPGVRGVRPPEPSYTPPARPPPHFFVPRPHSVRKGDYWIRHRLSVRPCTQLTWKVWVSMYNTLNVAHFAKNTIILSRRGTLELRIHWFTTTMESRPQYAGLLLGCKLIFQEIQYLPE